MSFLRSALLTSTAAALATSALHAQPATSAAATIDRATSAIRAAGTVRATFEQTLVNPLTGNQTKSVGELALAHPDKLSLRFAQTGDRVVADGRYLWVYLPSAAPGQVMRLPASRSSAVGLDVVRDLLVSPRAKYDVADAGSATLDGRATHAVRLTPKHDGETISGAKVWVDDADGSVRQIALTQDSGLERTWRMTSWSTSAKLDGSTFVFTVPRGAKVVDASDYRPGR